MYSTLTPTPTTKYDVIIRNEVIASFKTKAEADAEAKLHPHSIVRYYVDTDSLQ